MSSLDETSEKAFYRSRFELEREVFYNFKMKYQSNEYTYCMKISNDLIFNERTRIVSRFKDFLIYDDRTEFLKRFYDNSQNRQRLLKILQFYEMYSKIFPNYIAIPEREYLYKNIRKKQKMIDNFNIMKQAKENQKILSNEQKNKNEDNFFNTQIELSINKYKPCLNFKESQLQYSLLSLNDHNNYNNVNNLNSNNFETVKNSENEESFVSIKNILNFFNKKEVLNPLISDIKIKQIFNNKSKFMNNLEKENSENQKILKLKFQLQNKKTDICGKLNLKNLLDYKSNEKSPALSKPVTTNSNHNSITQISKNNKLLSEKINHKFLAQKIFHNKPNPLLETNSRINHQGDIDQNKLLKDKKKIIHRISSSIPDLRNFKMIGNNPNIIIPKEETLININKNIYNSENKPKEAERIIIVENLNIYNNSNYYSNESFKRSPNNFVKNIKNLKNFNSSGSRVKNYNSPYSSTIQKRSPSYTEKSKNGYLPKNMNIKNSLSRDSNKNNVVGNFVRKEEIRKSENVKFSSQNNFNNLDRPRIEERSYIKTIINTINKNKNIVNILGDVKENEKDSAAKSSDRLVQSLIKMNSKNNLMTNSISKMKEIKNAVKY